MSNEPETLSFGLPSKNEINSFASNDFLYKVELKQKDFNFSQFPDKNKDDLNGDGKPDFLKATNKALKIDFSEESSFEFSLEDKKYEGDPQLHDYHIVYPGGNKSFPSILLAISEWKITDRGWWTGSFPFPAKQILIFNNNGHFEAKETDISLVGRGLDCTRLETNKNTVCFYASYGDTNIWMAVSKLVEIEESGKVIDITSQYKLPWPRSGLNGFHMIGSAFLDFNKDALTDLVVVGQHSEIFSATLNKSGYFENGSFHPPNEDFLMVSAPEDSEILGLSVIPPCIYLAAERNESKTSDYLECYDKDISGWYRVDLPGGERYWMGYEKVIFYDLDNDNELDFAAKNENGEYDLFSFKKQALINKAPADLYPY